MDNRPQAANVKKNMSVLKRPTIQKGSLSCDEWRWNRTEIDRGAVVVGIAKKHGLEGWQGKELGSLEFSGDSRAGRNLGGWGEG